jgi:putative phosphoesterase
MIDRAVETLNGRNISLVLHAGDYCSPFTLAHFKKLHCNFIGVFGNNDGDHNLLTKRFQETTNCVIRDRFTQVNVEGFRVALLHGDETELLNALVDTGYFDAVIHGHSHNKGTQQKGKTLVINPGELCGYLTGKASFALLDTQSKETEIIEL